jgi:hypothetical protein
MIPDRDIWRAANKARQMLDEAATVAEASN